MEEDNSNNNKNNTGNSTGKVFLTYSNYIVNKGIPDSIFLNKKKTLKD
jgi:hypothetical protein